MKMVFTPEQKIFMIESYFRNDHQDENEAWVAVLCEHISETLRYTVHRFRESGRVQWKPGCGRPKVRTEENIATVQCRMENEPQLSLS
jgi:hypothetical protein